jgi:Ni/Co efflux regulator RcnB
MNTTFAIAAGFSLLAATAASAQVPTQPVDRPAPTERPGPPERPARPAPAPYRPGPSAPIRPGIGAPLRPVQPGLAGPNRPTPGVAIAHSGPGAPVKPVEPAPRYGVTRSAPGTRVDRGPWAHRSHWGWNGRPVHAGAYVFPHGHRYHRRHPGERLPLIFLSEIYDFADYAAAGFDDPPDGYEWIRYGPDLLLVDLDTGEVADVEYGVFD